MAILTPENEVLIRNMRPDEVLRYADLEMGGHPVVGEVCRKLNAAQEDIALSSNKADAALSYYEDARDALNSAEGALL